MVPQLSPAETLCLSCGFCCDGTLHNWTYLQPEELAGAVVAGLEVIRPRRSRTRQDQRPVFRQPCRALVETTCQVYSRRPQACRDYVCPVLRRLEAGELSLEAALDLVRQARRLIEALREKMPLPMGFLSLDWQVRVSWPASDPLPEDVQPAFDDLAAFLRREWKTTWRRSRKRKT